MTAKEFSDLVSGDTFTYRGRRWEVLNTGHSYLSGKYADCYCPTLGRGRVFEDYAPKLQFNFVDIVNNMKNDDKSGVL